MKEFHVGGMSFVFSFFVLGSSVHVQNILNQYSLLSFIIETYRVP